jgi:hypothetical protein
VVARRPDRTAAASDQSPHRYKDVHRWPVPVTEAVSGETVAWPFRENHVAFTDDPSGVDRTSVALDTWSDDGPRPLFALLGLVSSCECLAAC